jgi:hypothetical protein
MHSDRPRFVDHHPLAAAQDRAAYVIAWVLLAVTDGIDLGRGKVSAADIERAVDCRVRFRHRLIGAKESVWTRQMFIHFVTEWLQRLGCLQQPPKAPSAIVVQIDAFARQMRGERGLSPWPWRTRAPASSGRCWPTSETTSQSMNRWWYEHGLPTGAHSPAYGARSRAPMDKPAIS